MKKISREIRLFIENHLPDERTCGQWMNKVNMKKVQTMNMKTSGKGKNLQFSFQKEAFKKT